MDKFNDEFLFNIILILISVVFYFLSIYSLVKFLFNPNSALAWYDYCVEIVFYFLIGSLLFFKRKTIVKKVF